MSNSYNPNPKDAEYLEKFSARLFPIAAPTIRNVDLMHWAAWDVVQIRHRLVGGSTVQR